MVHVEAVVELLKPYGQDAIVVGYLHDVLEDSVSNAKEVETEFGVLVRKCVELLTDVSGQSRQVRKTKAYAKLSRVAGDEELALIVSAADRLANMQACITARDIKRLKMYLSEWNEFEAAVSRKGLCDGLWSALAGANAEASLIVKQSLKPPRVPASKEHGSD